MWIRPVVVLFISVNIAAAELTLSATAEEFSEKSSHITKRRSSDVLFEVIDYKNVSDLEVVNKTETKIYVKEDVGCFSLYVWVDGELPINFTNVTWFTIDGTAVNLTDYHGVDDFAIVDEDHRILAIKIWIIDNYIHDGNRQFFLKFFIPEVGVYYWIEICIWDDEWQIYGDPHFSVPLINGGKLCYSIQGVPGLAFNLLSSKYLAINALFVDSVNDPTQATWIGKMAVIPKHGGKKHPIVFDSVSQYVSIEGEGNFKPQFVQQIVINGTDGIQVKTTKGLARQKGNPSVTVILTQPMARFDVSFHADHLDVDWKFQTHQMDSSHGLLGQFMVKEVVIDSARKMLLRPGFEPVPVERSQEWNSPGNCWLAKNTGNQGEGLIHGSVLDYTVNNIESADFAIPHK